MKVAKIVYVSLISCLLLSLLFVKSGSAETKPTIRVEPTYFTGRAGGSFNLRLHIYDVGYYGIEDTDVYAWQVLMTWDVSKMVYSSVTWGVFMDVPRIGFWGLLKMDAPAGQKIMNVTDGSKYANPGAWGGTVLIQDDSNSETNMVTSQDGNQLTLQNNLAHTYTVAADGGCYPCPDLLPVATVGPAGNRIMVGQTTKGEAPGVQGGSGWLCTLTFDVLAEGTVALDIDHSIFGDQTYITNTLKEVIGDEPSGTGDPGNFQAELFKESGEFILPWDEDFDGDGNVGIFDLCSVALKFSEGPGYEGPEDINGDGYVNIDDLSLVSVKFGHYANA